MDFVFGIAIGICVIMIGVSIFNRNWLAWFGWFIANTMMVAAYLNNFG